MKLSKFPYVVQKEVLDQFSINNLFFLSLCSKNTKNFIKRIQNNQFKKVKCISYEINNTYMWIRVKTVSSDGAVMYFYKTVEDIQEKIFSVPVEEARFNELGTSIDFFCCTTRRKDLRLKYPSDNVESKFETIQNHFRDLFGDHIKCSWAYCSTDVSVIPMLPNLQTVQIRGDGLEQTRIDDLLSRSTFLENFSWWACFKRMVELREISKLYELDTIDLWLRNGPLTTDIIKNFNGRHAFLSGGRVTTTNVIQFLNSWKSGEKFRNLEVIQMGCFLDVQKIRNSVEFKEVNNEIEYSFIRKFPEGPSGFKTKLYIVRESDGHVASVFMERCSVYVGVWKMTEEEFLKKFQ